MLAYKGLLNATRPAYPATSCTLQRAAPRRACGGARAESRLPGMGEIAGATMPTAPSAAATSVPSAAFRDGMDYAGWAADLRMGSGLRLAAELAAAGPIQCGSGFITHSHSCLNHGYAAAYAAAGRICAASVSYGDPASWSLRGAAGLSGPAPRPPAPWRRPTNPPHAGVTRCRWPDGTPAPFAPFSLGPRRQVRPRCRTQTQCSRTRCV